MKPVLIEYKKARDGYGEGERFVVKSAAAAADVHPGATVLGYEDGSPLEAPKAEAKAPAAKQVVRSEKVEPSTPAITVEGAPDATKAEG